MTAWPARSSKRRKRCWSRPGSRPTNWRYGDYAGVGPGAHGRLTQGAVKVATRRFRAPETWLAAVERHGHGMQERVALAAEERREEMLMMGLRLAEGIDGAAFRAETGTDFAAALDPRHLADLVDGGFLEHDARRLRATPAGRQRLNAVLARLIASG
jgi:coproporphyrinogen III oxidase-like Fe-S oxidoreductase